MKINLPLSVWLPRKTMEDKRIHINMNWYRNAHHMTSNKVKELFRAHVAEEVKGSPPLPKGEYHMLYTIFPETGRVFDVMNYGAALDKFVCDALVSLGFFKDDNYKILPSFHFRMGGVDKENPRCELEIVRHESAAKTLNHS